MKIVGCFRLDEINFYHKFAFNIIKFYKYHLTDNSKKPIPYHYFGCLIKGSAKIKSQGAELSLSPHEIFYIPKGLCYQSEWFGEEIEFYSFGFEISPLNQSFSLQKIACNPKAQEIFHELCEDVRFTRQIIGKLYYFFELVATDMQKTEAHPLHPVIEKATKCLQENPHLKISELAKYCNISEPRIYSLFRHHLNKTPNEMKNTILCEKAVSLLTTTNKSVQEISDELNFSSTSYFRKVLKENTGKKPLEIRKEADF